MSRGNNRWIGLVIGVILPIIGVFGINQFQFPQLSFSEFLEHGWEVKAIGTWLRVAVLLNLLMTRSPTVFTFRGWQTFWAKEPSSRGSATFWPADALPGNAWPAA